MNGITGNAGDEMVEPHHERDDEENLTDGDEELFAVMSGHAVFTVLSHFCERPGGRSVHAVRLKEGTKRGTERAPRALRSRVGL